MKIVVEMREGPLSAAAHAILAAATLWHVVRDTFGLGALILLEFAVSQLCIKTLKHGVKAAATLLGNTSDEAFWRRPEGSGRGRDSPGFPSSHTANCASISCFIALRTGASLWGPALLTIAMAAGRMNDRSHRLSQTLAGVVIGPMLALLANAAVEISELDRAAADSLGWRVVSVVALLIAGAFFLRETLPAWLAVLGAR